MDRLNRLIIDSSRAVSELCLIGARFDTDKSPYNSGAHRHPYTAVYDLLFGARRYEALVFAEIGVLQNASMRMWHSYFPNASFHAFDVNETFLQQAREQGLERVEYKYMNVDNPTSIETALMNIGTRCDIIIDDSTHLFQHQTAIVPIALRHLKEGGVLIIEDVFRGWSEELYMAALKPFYEFFHSGYFLETEHENRKSDGSVEPYFDNDKLLVLFRNSMPTPSNRD